MTQMQTMTAAERVAAVIDGRQPDVTPVVGGWIACPEHICTLAEVSLDEYWQDPEGISIAAYRALGTDALVWNFVPESRDDFRCVDAHSYASATRNLSLAEVVEQVDALPEPEAIEAAFDFDAEYAAFRDALVTEAARCAPMVWMPAQWFAGAKISWYQNYGYENFFMLIGMHERQMRKLLEVGAAQGRLNGQLVARAIAEGLYPRAMFFGEDICTQRGPMVDPAWLEKHWIPLLRYSLEPLLEVNCRCIWHCDGDVRPVLDMILSTGIGGLQGFQPECGMTIDYVAGRRTRDGGRLLILGPLSVTHELPVLTPAQVGARTRHAIDVCAGQADLLLFTANTINPDVPLANLRAMYAARFE